MDLPPSYADIYLSDSNHPIRRGPDPSRLRNQRDGFWNKLFPRKQDSKGYRKVLEKNALWKPVTLKTPILCSVVIISGGLIAIIQILLSRSQSNKGIIFSENINDLPISKSFSYLYLPTILAVLYSFLWSWIDLDAKRLEPYHQLSKEGGAAVADSLLLDYPFDFIASVPLKAVKRRHWPVFTASVAMVFIFWGVTPSQTGIFATDNIVLAFPLTMLRSTDYLTLAEQQSGLTATYAQSVYNIAWLNESLPAFMTRDYMLAPFGPQETIFETKDSETWTSQTIRYSVDISCTTPQETESEYLLGPCNYFKPGASSDSSKSWSTLYVGYHNENGFADYYLSQDCPTNVSHNFLIRWSSNTWNYSSTTAINETALYCEPSYYQQRVNATVSLPDKSVLNVTALGPKTALPEDMFNTTEFEWGMSSGRQKFSNRGDYPTCGWPDMKSRLQDMDLDLENIPKMAGFAIAAYQRQAADYLNPELLRISYQAAYRLLFSRQLVDVLSSSLNNNTAASGQRQYESQSVIVVPAFAYLTEGLLGVVILFTTALLYLSITRPRKLNSDPATIASIMSLVADSPTLLESMKSLDRATSKDLENYLHGNQYALRGSDQDSGYRLEKVEAGSVDISRGSSPPSPRSQAEIECIRPKEFRLFTGAFLFVFFSAMLILFAVLYANIERSNGIPLPSENRFVRQLVENYLPTIVATFIEPIWVTLNRLLCTLQPFEELRRGKALSSRSITVDYNSLPPQLVFFKAFRARHFVLGAVCCMGLLANVLSVAFSALFNENIVSVSHAATYSMPLRGPLNATALSRTDDDLLQNRTNTDQFFVAMSNLTAGTALSSWADDKFYYLPFNSTNSTNEAWSHKATTRGFGGELVCEPLQNETGGSNSIGVVMDENGIGANYSIKITIDGDVCEAQKWIRLHGTPDGPELAIEVAMFVCDDYLVTGWGRANATRIAKETATLVDVSNVTFHSLDWFFLGCRGYTKTGVADVTVDYQGKVQTASSLQAADNSTQKHFVQNSTEIINLIHNVFETTSTVTDAGVNIRSWHNDSYPSDYYNYLIEKTTGSTRLLDPAQPLPSFNETAPQFIALYSELVAIMFSENSDMLFYPSSATTEGYNIKTETRIFMSKPMFVITEAILGSYLIVLILVYVRRPWRILPRLPTTIASNIGYFAASHAVQDLKGTSGMSRTTRNKHIEQMGHKYGFGSFIGTDERAHIGVERQPFFATLRRHRKGSDREESPGRDDRRDGTRPGLWRKWSSGLKNGFSGEVHEGGWI